jgi:hypothetical protein
MLKPKVFFALALSGLILIGRPIGAQAVDLEIAEDPAAASSSEGNCIWKCFQRQNRNESGWVPCTQIGYAITKYMWERYSEDGEGNPPKCEISWGTSRCAVDKDCVSSDWYDCTVKDSETGKKVRTECKKCTCG